MVPVSRSFLLTTWIHYFIKIRLHFLLTFGGAVVPGRHPVSVTAQRHQTSDDGCFTEAHVPNDQNTTTGRRVVAAEAGINFLEEPLPPSEEPIRRETRNLKV